MGFKSQDPVQDARSFRKKEKKNKVCKHKTEKIIDLLKLAIHKMPDLKMY